MFRKRTHLESPPSSFATSWRILLFLWNYSYCSQPWCRPWFTKCSGWWDFSSRKCRSATMPNMPRHWRSLSLTYMSACVSSHHTSITSYSFPESSGWFHNLRYSQANQLASRITYLPNNFSGEDLIAPCHCKGTQKYVHRSCLDNWRSTKVSSFSFLVLFLIKIIVFSDSNAVELSIFYINLVLIYSMFLLLSCEDVRVYLWSCNTYWLFISVLLGGLRLFSLYRVQSCLHITCKCPTRPLVVEIKIPVPCC